MSIPVAVDAGLAGALSAAAACGNACDWRTLSGGLPGGALYRCERCGGGMTEGWLQRERAIAEAALSAPAASGGV